MTFREEFEKAFVLWDCKKEVNEYEAFKAGAKWALEKAASLESDAYMKDKILKLAKELEDKNDPKA